jgi:hypothetical protein
MKTCGLTRGWKLLGVKPFMQVRLQPQGAFVKHDTTEPISTERKEIRTINGNLSEQPER